VLDVLFGDHRDTESATAVFRRMLGSAGTTPSTVVSDHHQPYVAAVQALLPAAQHIRTGLHRACGETTKPIERSHVPTRDRLRAARGLTTLATGQRFFEGFAALHALYRGHIPLAPLVPAHALAVAMPQQHARAVVRALHALGARLTRAA
jgi:transposase-like protein